METIVKQSLSFEPEFVENASMSVDSFTSIDNYNCRVAEPTEFQCLAGECMKEGASVPFTLVTDTRNIEFKRIH